MPRALPDQVDKVLTLRRRGIACRVRAKDSVGAFQDLRTLFGKNWVAGVSFGSDNDDPGDSATIRLWRDRNLLSLAPLVETSKANLLPGSYAPLIDAMREIVIEAAVLPEGVAVVSGDWIEVFRGFIDRPSWGGSRKNVLTLECRDLSAPLAEIVTEKEGRPDTSAYGTDPAGRPVEEVCQDVLDDWATPGGYTVVMYTPTGTAMDPRPIAERSGFLVTRFVPAKGQSVLETLRILAGSIGYDVRFRWSSVTNEFRLEFFNPPRGNTTPDVTIGPSQVLDVDRLEIDASSVRNAVRVTFQTNPDDEDTRTSTETTDATSIARYRRRWMEVAEAASSAINTSTEADMMRDAILHDLKDPKAEMIVSTYYRPDLVLNDLVRWSPDGRHFTANQDLACVGLRHKIEPGGKAETSIVTRGTPCGRYTTWLEVASGPGRGLGTHTYPGKTVTITLTAGIGSLSISIDSDTIVDRDVHWFEYHVSTSSGFTPDRSSTSTTRKARGQMTRVVVDGLTAGTTYYVKVLVVRRDGVVSTASAQQFLAPAKLGSTLLEDGAVKDQHVSAVAGDRIQATKLLAGSGPLTHLAQATGVFDNITNITARAVGDTTGDLPLARVSGAGDLAGQNYVTPRQIGDGVLRINEIAKDLFTFVAAADPDLAYIEWEGFEVDLVDHDGTDTAANLDPSSAPVEDRYGWVDLDVSATVVQSGSTPPAVFDPRKVLLLWAMSGDPQYALEVTILPAHGRRDDFAPGFVPIGAIVAWHKNIAAALPPLPDNWVECNGGTISDAESPIDGEAIPDLNGDARFLRGGSTSGTEEAEDTLIPNHSHSHTLTLPNHAHTQQRNSTGALGTNTNTATSTTSGTPVAAAPPTGNPTTLPSIAGSISSGGASGSETRPINMSVVWIMRIK